MTCPTIVYPVGPFLMPKQQSSSNLFCQVLGMVVVGKCTPKNMIWRRHWKSWHHILRMIPPENNCNLQPGVVVKLGPGVTTLKVGDRVGHAWLHDSCGGCDYCLAGWETASWQGNANTMLLCVRRGFQCWNSHGSHVTQRMGWDNSPVANGISIFPNNFVLPILLGRSRHS